MNVRNFASDEVKSALKKKKWEDKGEKGECNWCTRNVTNSTMKWKKNGEIKIEGWQNKKLNARNLPNTPVK